MNLAAIEIKAFVPARNLSDSIVRLWDPYRLIGSGAPPDEFDAEIAKVVSYIPRISNAATAAAALSSVFSAAFESELFLLLNVWRLGKSSLLSCRQQALWHRPNSSFKAGGFAAA